MYSVQKPRSAMIVDSDSAFLQEMKDDPKASMSPPVIARTGKEAQLTFANLDIPIAGLFVNINVTTPEGGPGGTSVIKFAHQLRPSTPIYILLDEGISIEIEDFKSLGVRNSITKPVTYTKMLELVAPHAIMFDQSAMQAKKNTDVVGKETVADDSEFVAIRASDFVSGKICSFNIYYRFASGKYIKILAAGDSFAPERLSVYLQKGAEFFHLRKEDQSAYLSYCNQIASKVVQSKTISVAVKTGQALNYGQETLSFLKSQGLSESNLSHATNFVENVHNVVSQMGMRKSEVLKNFFKNVEGYEHGVSVSMITSLLANVSGIESESIVQIVGIASLLHDIGLYSLPPELHHEDESQMTKEQFELYRTHTEIGADLLKKIPGTHPTVIQAVLQHHERRGKKAFRTSGKPTSMNRIAELIGIADEYILLMKLAKADPKIDIHQQLEKNVFPCFSSTVVEAFRSVFFVEN